MVATPRNRLTNLAAATAFFAAALCCWAGCSVERDYRVLSTFFDGVPNPNAKAATQSSSTPGLARAGQANKGTRVIASTHKPFSEEKCTACHAEPTQVFASALNSDLCMKCHQKVMDAYPSMHGAVVGKACLWCHEPHESAFPALLKTTDASICIQCHERPSLSTRVDAHRLDVGSCLDCHGGHGGDRPPFLHASSAASRPTTPAPEKP